MKKQVYFKIAKKFEQDMEDKRIGHQSIWYYITKTVGLHHLDFEDPTIGDYLQNRYWCLLAEQICIGTGLTLDTYFEGEEDYKERQEDFNKIIKSLKDNTDISINDIKGPCSRDDKGKLIVANIAIAKLRERSREFFRVIIDKCIRNDIEVIFDYEEEWSPNRKDNKYD
jgi:hypothetical protein